MSGSIDKTKLGAGDGLRIPTIARNKLRTPVPSSRRFTPRTPSRDNERADVMKQRLQEALESETNRHERTTPIRCRRAQTLAEITPSKKTFGGANAKDRSLIKNVSSGSLGSTSGLLLSNIAVDKWEGEDEQRYDRNAGRRVYEQLLLNAWRHRRRDAAILADSSAQLQQQVQQLQMQVDVLQQLRQSEGKRRSEAALDNCLLRTEMIKYEEKCLEIIKEKDDLLVKQELLETNLSDLKLQLASEHDLTAKLTTDLINNEKNTHESNKIINELTNTREILQNKAVLLDEIVQNEQKKVKNLSSDIINLENVIHSELMRNKKTSAALESTQTTLNLERGNAVKLQQELVAMQQHGCKSAQKLGELKKRLCVANEIKRRVLQENGDLRSAVAELRLVLRRERECPWWRTSGRLVGALVHGAAYRLLPNLPRNQFWRGFGPISAKDESDGE